VDPDPSEDFAAIGLNDTTSDRPRWMFTKVAEGKRAKNRVHPDLTCPNRPAEVERVIALGATRLGDYDQDGAKWTTLTDPEGNEFDIVAQQAG